jgi:CheY-like chemotaxis protein
MPANIIAVVDDLFFASKIRGTAEELGVKVSFSPNVSVLIETAHRDPPSLIICDLHSQKVDAMELAKQLKADEQLCSIPLLGFFSHVQTQLQRQAEEAGFDRVMPRSAFTKNLALILQDSWRPEASNS